MEHKCRFEEEGAEHHVRRFVLMKSQFERLNQLMLQGGE
jgi:hypothetical protein